jgi:leader peptidase (prepilin peptidase)/N-methyltransferase
MWIVAFIAVVTGLVAARTVVAESDAHRLDRPDRWWDPICDQCDGGLSFVMLRCRASRHRQRRSNAVVLVALPLLMVAMVFGVPSLWVWPAYAVFTISMVLLTVTDLDTKLIPNRILGPSIVACAVLLFVGWVFDRDAGSMIRSVLGALAYFFAMYVLALIARGGLGFGDVKLAFLIGMMTGFLGWGPVLVAGILGFVIGGVVSLALVVSGRLTRKDAIPFGPFMVAAGLVATAWGVAITDWYIT